MRMAGKGKDFYVYAILDGETVLYVGKGSGRRSQRSAKNNGGTARILERFSCEDKAFARERYWIAELLPQNNKCAGGNGGRCQPKKRESLPKWYRDTVAEMERVGSRVYAARLLCRKIAEHNCELWGVSKLDLIRLREVAYG